jgi:hypothetical protein
MHQSLSVSSQLYMCRFQVRRSCGQLPIQALSDNEDEMRTCPIMQEPSMARCDVDEGANVLRVLADSSPQPIGQCFCYSIDVTTGPKI